MLGKLSDIQAVIAEQNPWWIANSVPEEFAKRTERSLAQLLFQSLHTDAPHRFQLILGPRRVGKTTVVYQTVRKLLDSGVPARRLVWLRLDHPYLMQMSLGSLVKGAIESRRDNDHPLYLFLDELTYATDWDLWLKTFYDEHYPVRIAGTSSSVAALRERRPESGVGRWEEQHLPPYSFREYLALCNESMTTGPATLAEAVDDIISSSISSKPRDLSGHRRRYLLAGGFPELIAEGAVKAAIDDENLALRSQRVLRSDAVQTALYKDLPQAFGIGEPVKLERLLYTLAGQLCGVMSTLNLSRDVELSQPTIDTYVRYLEQAFIVFTLPNYSVREEGVQRRGRKVYFWDGAVRNAALQRGIAPLRDHSEMGALMENAFASHLNALSQQTGVRVYHWRAGKDEVDFIYDDPTGPWAFEVASSRNHSTDGLYALKEAFPRVKWKRYVVYPDATPLQCEYGGNEPGRLPYDRLLVELGRCAETAMRARLVGNLGQGSLFD